MPSIVAIISSHGSRRLRKRNCPDMLPFGNAGSSGTQLRRAHIVAHPHTAAKAKISLHDSKWPIMLPMGTPARLAIVIPIIMIATADVLLPFSARLLAMMEPAPKNAPCGSPDMNRATRATWYCGDTAMSRLPAIWTAIRNIGT